MKKKFLAGLLVGALTIIPALNITTVEAKSAKATVTVEQTIDNRANEKGQPPEPPKDENGNPLPPPDMKDRGDQSNGDQSDRQRPSMRRGDQSSDDQSSDRQRPPMRGDQSDENGQPPEPPKDENGNPLPPPDHNSDRSDRNQYNNTKGDHE